MGNCSPAPQATLPPNLAPDKLVLGYFAHWAPERGYFVSDILANIITHIDYAFSDVGESGECILGNPAAEIKRVYSMTESVSGIPDSNGAGCTTRFKHELGTNDLVIRRGPEDSKAYPLGLNNSATACSLMQALFRLARRSVVSPDASDEMIAILRQ